MYIDPNTGGMLFQAMAAIFAFLTGAVLLFSSRIRLAVARLKRKIRGDSDPVGANESETEQV